MNSATTYQSERRDVQITTQPPQPPHNPAPSRSHDTTPSCSNASVDSSANVLPPANNTYSVTLTSATSNQRRCEYIDSDSSLWQRPCAPCDLSRLSCDHRRLSSNLATPPFSIPPFPPPKPHLSLVVSLLLPLLASPRQPLPTRLPRTTATTASTAAATVRTAVRLTTACTSTSRASGTCSAPKCSVSTQSQHTDIDDGGRGWVARRAGSSQPSLWLHSSIVICRRRVVHWSELSAQPPHTPFLDLSLSCVCRRSAVVLASLPAEERLEIPLRQPHTQAHLDTQAYAPRCGGWRKA